MFEIWIEIIVSVAVTFFGILLILRFFKRGRYGKILWSVFKSTFKESKVELIKGKKTRYGLPDIYGKLDGRGVYIHPVPGKRGRNRESMTIAVENDIEISSDILISSPETSKIRDETIDLDVPNLNKYGYIVSSKKGKVEDEAKRIFTKEVSTKVHRLIEDHKKNFRAVMVESGLCLFSKFEWETDKQNLKDIIYRLKELSEELEKNTEKINEDFTNERLDYFYQGSYKKQVDIIFTGILISISLFLLYSLMDSFSFIFFDVAVIALAVALVRIYGIITSREWT